MLLSKTLFIQVSSTSNVSNHEISQISPIVNLTTENVRWDGHGLVATDVAEDIRAYNDDGVRWEVAVITEH